MNKENLVIDVSKRKNMKIIYPSGTIDEEMCGPRRCHNIYEESAVIRELNKTSTFKYLLNSYKEVGKMICKKFIKERNCFLFVKLCMFAWIFTV